MILRSTSRNISRSSFKQGEMQGKTFLFLITGFAFLLLFFATWHTVKIAYSGHEPVVDAGYYEKGLNFDKEIAKNNDLLKEGYSIESKIFEKNPVLKTGKNTIEVSFLKDKTNLSGSILKITKERSATSKFNTTSPMNEISSGVYSGEIDFPFEGEWILNVSATTNGKTLEKRVTISVEK